MEHRRYFCALRRVCFFFLRVAIHLLVCVFGVARLATPESVFLEALEGNKKRENPYSHTCHEESSCYVDVVA